MLSPNPLFFRDELGVMRSFQLYVTVSGVQFVRGCFSVSLTNFYVSIFSFAQYVGVIQ